jgi:pimeloyl-ACP methyl ester carboxylesterase
MNAAAALERIVLVHGAAHGAWCWERVVPLLRARGFAVDALDLPGLGADLTPPRDVTFDNYLQRVLQTVRARPERVLLVGHSMGGTPVAAAAEAACDQVGRLLFLAAALPVDGEGLGMLLELAERFPGRSASTALRPSQVEGAMEFAPELAAEAFYNQCDADTARAAVARLRPQATGPLQSAPVRLTAERYGTVPKSYVICTRDQALPPDLQRWLSVRTPGTRVSERPWDHSPFLAAEATVT